MAEREISRIQVVLDGYDEVKTLAEGLKLIREEREWSQGEVAKRLEIHPSTVSFIESGKRAPSLDVLEMLLGLYGYEILIMKKDQGEGWNDLLREKGWGGE